MSPELVLVIRANSIGMDDEPDPATTNPEQALFWRNIYTEILTMEEAVLDRIRQLMATQSPEARHEVELTNVPVVVAQVERFRARWESGTPLSECMRRKAALLAARVTMTDVVTARSALHHGLDTSANRA